MNVNSGESCVSLYWIHAFSLKVTAPNVLAAVYFNPRERERKQTATELIIILITIVAITRINLDVRHMQCYFT